MKQKRDYLVATPITMSVHKRGEDPHGEGAVHVTAEYYEGEVRLLLGNMDSGDGYLTLAQLTEIGQAARVLVAHFNDNGEVRR